MFVTPPPPPHYSTPLIPTPPHVRKQRYSVTNVTNIRNVTVLLQFGRSIVLSPVGADLCVRPENRNGA